MSENRSRLGEILSIARKNELTKGITPEKFRRTLEDLGPVYIKLGQILSNRSDVLPKAYCEELENLRSDVEPMPYEQVLQVISSSYDRPWSDVFSFIERRTLGSASIAQVHKATLRTGEEVVVKVQRPGVYDMMKRDIGLLHRLVRLLPPLRIKDMLNPDMILDELWVVAQEEMNFLQEAGNIEEFTALNKGIEYIAMPKFYRAYTTNRVLVMEYIDGYDIDDVESLRENGYDLEEIGTKVVDHYVKQVMEDGFFHADPHPGNIVIRDGKIVWIDMGMMGRFSPHDRKEISKAIEGIAKGDIGQVQEAIIEIAEFRGKPDKIKLYKDLSDLLDRYGDAAMEDIDIAEFLQNILEIMQDNHMVLPQGMTLLARGLAQLEGVLRDLAPNLSILQIATYRVQSSMLQPGKIKENLKETAMKMGIATSDLVSIPTLLARILREYQKGQTRINLDLHSSEQLVLLLHHLVRNLVIGLCEAALLISASIICTTDMWPKLFGIPALGAFGYMTAIAVAAFLVIRYFIRTHRRRKK